MEIAESRHRNDVLAVAPEAIGVFLAEFTGGSLDRRRVREGFGISFGEEPSSGSTWTCRRCGRGAASDGAEARTARGNGLAAMWVSRRFLGLGLAGLSRPETLEVAG